MRLKGMALAVGWVGGLTYLNLPDAFKIMPFTKCLQAVSCINHHTMPVACAGHDPSRV